MVLRVWTMVEANLRSSSLSSMSAMEWKMFSAFRSRQSCLCVTEERNQGERMVNEHNQDSDVRPLLQRGPGRRSGCTRGWVSVVAPKGRCCGANQALHLENAIIHTRTRTKIHSWAKTCPWSYCFGTLLAPITMAHATSSLHMTSLRRFQYHFPA